MSAEIKMNLTPGSVKATFVGDNGNRVCSIGLPCGCESEEDELWELFNRLMELAYGNKGKPESEPEAANVDGKFVCTKAEKLPLTVGKVYEVKNGLMENNNGNKYPIYDNPPALIGATFVPYIPAKEPETLYNGRVICVDCPKLYDFIYTVGKEYIITNGWMENDSGSAIQFKSFEDLCENSSATWAEVKE